MDNYIAKVLQLFLVACTATSLLMASEQYQEVSTIAGDGEYAFKNGPALSASFRMPHGVACDLVGNVYIADTYNDCVRKINVFSQKVITFCIRSPKSSGLGIIALFNKPRGITCDSIGNIYVADSYNNRICKIDFSFKKMTVIAGSNFGFADGEGSVAKFWNPYGIVCDSKDNLYVTDKLNQRIRKLSLSMGSKTWIVTTVAGNGKAGFNDNVDGLKAQFQYPTGITCDQSGNIFVVDTSNQRIRKITSDAVVTTIAGDGAPGYANNDQGLKAQFCYPYGITCNSRGDLYMADKINNRIRKITQNGCVSTVAGAGSSDFLDATCLDAHFFSPYGIACDGDDNLYVADTYNNRIRKIKRKPEEMDDESLPDILLKNFKDKHS